MKYEKGNMDIFCPEDLYGISEIQISFDFFRKYKKMI